ncbi:conserved hypothetical protein [Ricinus communis]|uniref:RNase H type-1 domain-containing protein n=1 Tax=Ricinus communis TaxID=3988 RepID=B9SER8_RICCO|nr:conserved hypothetical protein [Ricinus communis]
MVIVESDSNIAVGMLNHGYPVDWEVKAIVEDIWGMHNSLRSCFFHFVFGSANLPADWVAKAAKNNGFPCIWHHSMPSSLWILVNSDVT